MNDGSEAFRLITTLPTSIGLVEPLRMPMGTLRGLLGSCDTHAGSRFSYQALYKSEEPLPNVIIGDSRTATFRKLDTQRPSIWGEHAAIA